ncbi:hypothetical protein D9M72_454890 [compost metagenome]
MQPQPSRRHEHVHRGGAKPEIARQRQVRAAAIDAAVDLGNGHRAAVLHCVDQGLEAGTALPGREPADIEAAAEVLAGAAQAQHTHVAGIHGIDMPLQLGQVIRPEAVGHLRAAQGDRGDMTGNVERRKGTISLHREYSR